MQKPVMMPSPGERLVRFVGDQVQFVLRRADPDFIPGCRAFLRTNLGKAATLRKEIISTYSGKRPLSVAFWRDIPMQRQSDGFWSIALPVTEVGYFRAKAYLVDPLGRQIWPDGADVGLSIHPDHYRTANTIYCAFARMFGETKWSRSTRNELLERKMRELDERGFTVIPPSGKLRDLKRELPHIIDKLGCRILHLLPINPTPTTMARFGRFGSPYACLDLTAIDPALVDFDKRSNGVDQFRELAYETHLRGARVFLDVVINHTGWGSALFEDHPEWFLRGPDGTFISPGAWGNIWADLVEMNPNYTALWEHLADAFLVWCRRGVDGFRCDAGYKVPLPVWQYIEARVRQEFPNTIFLLEGLGGSWEATETLLTEGGMQWAYSELFQNYSGEQVSWYLDYALRQSERSGIYVHYSETHDNDRLAKGGRAWSLLRNRLCALTSVSGGFGFTCGVEWLADEKIEVHESRGLHWNNPDNLIPELAALNDLLANHPCFFDSAKLTRLSADSSPVYALQRVSAEGSDAVLVLVNTDTLNPHPVSILERDYCELREPKIDLLGQGELLPHQADDEEVEFLLAPGAAHCLASTREPKGLAGDAYREARAQAAWAITALSRALMPEETGAYSWRELAAQAAADPKKFLAAVAAIDRRLARTNLLQALKEAEPQFPQVVTWTLEDRRRITPVPPLHWLLLQDSAPFRARVQFENDTQAIHLESIPAADGHFACIPPRDATSGATAELTLERYALAARDVRAQLRFLSAEPQFTPLIQRNEQIADNALALLTNGIGGMARMCVDLGRIRSKYDCALGANLHPSVPVDRHVFVKRVRAWVNADGFITPLNLQNLASFDAGPPAFWRFVANAGDERSIEIHLHADMIEGRNATVLRFSRPSESFKTELPADRDVRLTVRVDIEDRSFHAETHRNPAAGHHFESNCRPLPHTTGFEFTPADDRQLRVFSDRGAFYPDAEWSQGVEHPVEQSRGQVGHGDAYSPGWFDLPLPKGDGVSLTLCADSVDPPAEMLHEFTAHRALENNRAVKGAGLAETDSFGRQLALAARAFVVRRDAGKTVIAGYPWFLDWGRDSLIAARGLLTAGLVPEVTELLINFGRFAENGTLPNAIHGEDASNRNTSDAPLWYGVVCEETAHALSQNLYELPVDKTGRRIADVLREIAVGYSRGTTNGICMDAASGLIWSPIHFTWMDTNYPACTPREGYPVEIQALWIRLLRQLDGLGIKPESEPWAEMADRAERSLHQFFWLKDRGYFADVLLAGPGQPAATAIPDNALRSNYLLAVSLGLVRGQRARDCVEAAIRHLVVPGALRSLAPLPVFPPLPVHAHGRLVNNPDEPYFGFYLGDEDTQRKPAYHNGTAWTWTFPAFCEALAVAWDFSPEAVTAAKAYLGSMEQLLNEGCLGHIPEILDGDAPHAQRGCDAQAWGATEALRVWKRLNHRER